MSHDFTFSQAERRLQSLVNKESQLESRLGELVQEVAALQDKSRANQKLAQEATGKAQRASAAAGRLENVSSSFFLSLHTISNNRIYLPDRLLFTPLPWA